MNLQQYKKICSACDRILHSAGNNDEIVSFPILHVIREHPEYLKQPTAFILPHLGSATKKTRTAMADLAIDNIDEYFKTGNAKNKVN